MLLLKRRRICYEMWIGKSSSNMILVYGSFSLLCVSQIKWVSQITRFIIAPPYDSINHNVSILVIVMWCWMFWVTSAQSYHYYHSQTTSRPNRREEESLCNFSLEWSSPWRCITFSYTRLPGFLFSIYQMPIKTRYRSQTLFIDLLLLFSTRLLQQPGGLRDVLRLLNF